MSFVSFKLMLILVYLITGFSSENLHHSESVKQTKSPLPPISQPISQPSIPSTINRPVSPTSSGKHVSQKPLLPHPPPAKKPTPIFPDKVDEIQVPPCPIVLVFGKEFLQL